MAKSQVPPKVQRELRNLPSVAAFLASAVNNGLFPQASANSKVAHLRQILAEARRQIIGGAHCPSSLELLKRLAIELQERQVAELRPVLNATGIPLHTNLGRAPLPREIFRRVEALSTGYCNLELDLGVGVRGGRAENLRRTFSELTGAEDVAIVNNGAAAVFLALGSLAAGRSVAISRGELVQIGGGFRMPDIIAASGAHLKEVGTTNMTTVSDFLAALDEGASLLFKVHRSNFFLGGHVEEASLQGLAAMAKKYQVPLVYDLGSGALVRWQGHNAVSEPTVQDALQAGADLVCFSGDKLLGGVQAGIVAGKASLIQRLVKHPIYRALRPGRMTLAFVQELLRYYSENDYRKLPVWRAIEPDLVALRARTKRFTDTLNHLGMEAEMSEKTTSVGGGVGPNVELPTYVISLPVQDSARAADSLRRAVPPVIARIDDGRLLVDLRCIEVEDEPGLLSALQSASTNISK